MRALHSSARGQRCAVSRSVNPRLHSLSSSALYVLRSLPVAVAKATDGVPTSNEDTTPSTSTTPWSFGFSAGGLLFPYFVGCAFELERQGYLQPETPVAGASAGSLIAACCKSGLTPDELTAALLDLAHDCRTKGTRHRLKSVLKRVLQETLPDDVHERLSGRCHVAVTRVWPNPQSLLISEYTSKQDAIDTLLVSCHIPWYFDGDLVTRYREGLYFDGGITNFIPSPPNTLLCHKVCCFPEETFRTAFGGITISPSTYEDWPHDMQRMLQWAFEPAEEAMLLDLIDKGRRDARAWSERHGEATLSLSSGSWSSGEYSGMTVTVTGKEEGQGPGVLVIPGVRPPVAGAVLQQAVKQQQRMQQ